VPLALAIALGGCMLPRPVSAPDYTSTCPESPVDPPLGSLLFVTLRLADCRNYPRIIMTWHRAGEARFAALGADDRISFHREDTWLRSAKEQIRAAASAGRPAVIFIHGYNTGHHEAVTRARAIRTAIDGDRPVIALTWPSYASGAKYFWDEANSDWTSVQARALLVELVAGTPVVVVAHSMGNRIALDAARALRQPNGSSPIRELIMAAPDVDRAALSKELARDGAFGTRVTIYGSRKDQPLSGSWRLHGYARAGDLSHWVVGQHADYRHFKDINGVTVVDTTTVSRDFWAHDAFIGTYEGAADLCRVIRGVPTDEWRDRADDAIGNVWLLRKAPATSDQCSLSGWNAARLAPG
jgi:esterase/lipase superfamily enzyme